jgi:hypothetical protein
MDLWVNGNNFRYLDLWLLVYNAAFVFFIEFVCNLILNDD